MGGIPHLHGNIPRHHRTPRKHRMVLFGAGHRVAVYARHHRHHSRPLHTSAKDLRHLPPDFSGGNDFARYLRRQYRCRCTNVGNVSAVFPCNCILYAVAVAVIFRGIQRIGTQRNGYHKELSANQDIWHGRLHSQYVGSGFAWIPKQCQSIPRKRHTRRIARHIRIHAPRM